MIPILKPISVVLKEARQNKGVSLEVAYKATKIHTNILRSLEDGTTLGLSHVYVKGYIKIYAKYLGIGKHELDKYFLPEPQKEKKISFDVPFKAKGEKIKNLSEPEDPINGFLYQIKRFKKIIIALVVFILVLASFSLLRGIVKKETLPTKKAAAKKLSIIPKNNRNKASNKAKETITTKEQIGKPKATDVLRLTIFAQEDTWMQIRLDGKVVFKKILKKSTSETWLANENFELWIANAGTVDLELNGKILPPLGKRGQLLKSVLITQEGFTVK